MPKITFISSAGEATTVDARSGASVMQCAVSNGIAEIIAECGGACSCSTCHVYVAQEWSAKLPEPLSMERETLEFAVNRQPASRLGCQIKMTPELDGLVVHTPESQY